MPLVGFVGLLALCGLRLILQLLVGVPQAVQPVRRPLQLGSGLLLTHIGQGLLSRGLVELPPHCHQFPVRGSEL
ncbi:hypothetical protein ACWGDT_11390 [Streptomyces avermitilis]